MPQDTRDSPRKLKRYRSAYQLAKAIVERLDTVRNDLPNLPSAGYAHALEDVTIGLKRTWPSLNKK